MSIAQNLVYKADLSTGAPIVNLSQPLVVGDQNAHKFIVNLTDKGYKANLENATCRAYFVRKKQGVYEAETIVLPGTVNTDSASVTLNASCYSRSAYFSLFVKLSDNVTGEIRTALIVRGTVITSQDGTVLDPEDVVLSLDELLAQISAMEQATAEAMEAAAAADVAREGIQGDLAAISDEIGDYDKYVGAIPVVKAEAEPEVLTLTASNGEMSYNSDGTLNFGTQTYWQHGYVEVIPGEMYEVQAYFGSGKQSEYVAVADDSLNVLGKWLRNDDKLNYALSDKIIITIPDGATKLYICGFYAQTSGLVSNIKPKKINNTYYGSHAEAIKKALDSTAENAAKISELSGNADANVGEIAGKIAEYDKFVGANPVYKGDAEPLTLTATDGEMSYNSDGTLKFGTQTYWKNGYIEVSPGEVYEVYAYFGSSKKSEYVAAVDDDLYVLGKWLPNTDGTNYAMSDRVLVTIPQGATKLYVCGFYTSASTFKSSIKPRRMSIYGSYAEAINAAFSGNENSALRAFHTMPVTMELGSTDRGKPTSSTTRCRSTETIVMGNGTKLECPAVDEGWKFELVMYDLYTDAYIGATGWIEGEYTVESDCKALVVMNRNNATLTEEDLANAPGKLLMSYMPPMGYLQNVSVRDMELPEYYHADGYMDGRLDTIRSHEDACSYAGDGFIFLTDYHRATSHLRSPALVRHIVNRTSIKRMFFGGDAVTEYSDKDQAKEEMLLARRDFDYLTGDKYLAVIGNHELNNAGGSADKVGQQLSASEAYAYVAKANEDIYTVLDEYAYFWDNRTQRIRYYLIGCNYTSLILPETISKVLESFGQIPDGYSVVVVSHAGIKDSAAELDSRFAVIAAGMDALKNKTAYEYNGQTYDYSGKNVDVICAITGHRHVDGHVVSAGGTLVIATTSDTPNEASLSTLTRTKGTITESAFDVVQIDKAGRKVHLTRIGAGEDREFSF